MAFARARISDGSTDETAATSSYRAVVVSLLCGSLRWKRRPRVRHERTPPRRAPTREALGADDVAVPELHVESFILANVSPRVSLGRAQRPHAQDGGALGKCKELLAAEFRAGGCLGVDASRACTISPTPPRGIRPRARRRRPRAPDGVTAGEGYQTPRVGNAFQGSRSTRSWRFPQIRSSTRTAKAARDAPTTTASSTSTPRRCAPRERTTSSPASGHVAADATSATTAASRSTA